MQQSYRIRVADVITETPDAVSIVFDLDPSIADRFRYRPGQFLTLRVPSDLTGSVARCYSLSSSPHTDRQLSVAVKRTPDGYASNWLCDNVTPGTELVVLPPSGTFGPTTFEGDFLLFAAGSGVTPIMSIIKSVLSEGCGNVAAFYANRDPGSVIYGRQLAELEAAHPGRLALTHWIEQDCGLPSAQAVAGFARNFPERAAYACGPKGFMSVVQQGLRDSGAFSRSVHVENFVSLTRNPFEDDESKPIDVDGPARTAVTVNLNGDEHVLAWPDGVPLLKLLLAKGFDPPFACEEGTCGSCVCRVDKGTVEMLSNQTLEQDDVDEGYVLACQAVPTGGDVRISYE